VASQWLELDNWTGEAQEALRPGQGGSAFKGNGNLAGTESGTEPGPPVAP